MTVPRDRINFLVGELKPEDGWRWVSNEAVRITLDGRRIMVNCDARTSTNPQSNSHFVGAKNVGIRATEHGPWQIVVPQSYRYKTGEFGPLDS